MNREYAEKVEVLLRLLPIVMDEKVFAVHGGSAINLFVRDLPRYSVDIDLTYIPLEGREESLEHINAHLMSIADKAKRAFRGMHIVPKLATSKLLCEYQGKQVKVEVNQTKRGIIGGDLQTSIPLCEKAQKEFGCWIQRMRASGRRRRKACLARSTGKERINPAVIWPRPVPNSSVKR